MGEIVEEVRSSLGHNLRVEGEPTRWAPSRGTLAGFGCQRMKIGLFTQSYPGLGPDGGIGTYTRQLAQGLASSGHDIHVLTTGLPGEFDDGPVRIHQVRADYLPLGDRLIPGLGASLRVCLAMRKLVRQARLDVVEFPNWEGMGIGFAFQRPTPMVVRLSTSSLTSAAVDHDVTRTVRWESRRERCAAWRADALVTHSEAHARTMAKELGVDFGTIDVAPLAVETYPEFVRPPRDHNDLSIVFMGRLERRKGTIDLLLAVPEIVREFPEARFILIGTDRPHCPGGRTHAQFVAEELPSEVRSQITFTGRLPQDEVDAILQKADLFVAPSLYESFGLIFLEAMRWGTPVIGTTAGGIPEIVQDGISGRLVPPGNHEALAASIIALLRDEPERRRLGEAGRRRVESHFTVEVMARRAADLYSSVLEGRRWKNR